MLLLRRPGAARVAEVLEAARHAGFNYTRKGPFFQNETNVFLGRGDDCWLAAVGKFRCWKFVQLGWCDFLVEGDVLAARVTHLGFWSLNPSRIVSAEREERQLSFTIRTLNGHEECGEERFTLEWLPSGEVRFTIRSYSRPASVAGWLALPYVRHLQRRFGREVAHFMQTG
jgi:uncharacterized protein (UPF0548 family)